MPTKRINLYASDASMQMLIEGQYPHEPISVQMVESSLCPNRLVTEIEIPEKRYTLTISEMVRFAEDYSNLTRDSYSYSYPRPSFESFLSKQLRER